MPVGGGGGGGWGRKCVASQRRVLCGPSSLGHQHRRPRPPPLPEAAAAVDGSEGGRQRGAGSTLHPLILVIVYAAALDPCGCCRCCLRLPRPPLPQLCFLLQGRRQQEWPDRRRELLMGLLGMGLVVVVVVEGQGPGLEVAGLRCLRWRVRGQ
jgi:hypothetical protein